MCNFWSAIITSKGEVLYNEESNNHSEIIKTHELAEANKTLKKIEENTRPI